MRICCFFFLTIGLKWIKPLWVLNCWWYLPLLTFLLTLYRLIAKKPHTYTRWVPQDSWSDFFFFSKSEASWADLRSCYTAPLGPCMCLHGERWERSDREQSLCVQDRDSPERQELEAKKSKPETRLFTCSWKPHNPARETCDVTENYAPVVPLRFYKYLKRVHMFLRVDGEAMFRWRRPAEPRGVWVCVS